MIFQTNLAMESAFLVTCSRVFHDPLVSLNFEVFDPPIFSKLPQNLLVTFFNSYGGGHCDPIKRKWRGNPAAVFNIIMKSNLQCPGYFGTVLNPQWHF